MSAGVLARDMKVVFFAILACHESRPKDSFLTAGPCCGWCLKATILLAKVSFDMLTFWNHQIFNLEWP